LKNVLIFGSENLGMKKLMIENCDTICKIPISPNIESLNVSNAVAATLSILNFNKK
jgi:23S rRNA (guanosine2251-2'-O)-methyltransferase